MSEASDPDTRPSESSQIISLESNNLALLPPSEPVDLLSQPYEYTPLKDSEVRLLDLLPSTGDDQCPIPCRLYHVSIDNMPPYEALSYSWDTDLSGQTTHPTIYIDGKALKIMPNLEAFLRQHRHDQDSPCLPLWIDAICINQNDLVERRQQVAMMCKLYTQLSRLVVWLGINDDLEIQIAIELIKLNANAKMEGQESLGMFQKALASRFQETGFNYAVYVAKFLSRPWFFRSWIVQEYVLGSQKCIVVFKYGSLQLSRHDMEALGELSQWNWVVPMAEQTTIPLDAEFTLGRGRWAFVDLARALLSLRYQTDGIETPINFLYWLSVMRRKVATDPRDKIHAALGLSESYGQNDHSQVYDRSALIVDYDATIQNVYSSLVKSLVASTERLNVLLACAERSCDVQRSWVPDWSCSSGMPGFMGGFYGSTPLIGRESFYSSGTEDALATFAEDLSTMTVRGLIWDKVRDTLIIADESPLSDGTGIASTSSLPIPGSWIDHGPYASKRHFVRSLWQTFLLEIDGDMRDLLSDDQLIELGLNDSTDPTTNILRRDSPSSHLDLLTPSIIRRGGSQTGRIMFITSKGFIGKDFSGTVETGDLICVLLGCPAPVTLRRVESHYEFIRSVYVDGIMFGEAIEALGRGEVELEEFELH